MENEFYATTEDKGVRLDKFLVGKLVNCTRGEIIRMIKSGAIIIGGKNVKPSYSIKGDERIEIGEYEEGVTKIVPNRNIFLDIIESTSNFVIVNKEKGLQVHPSHRERSKTLVNALLAQFPEIRDVGEDEERPGIVHRIDKETTGLLVVAKNQQTFDELKELFSERKVQKTYHAIVFGHFDEKKGIIDAPIARATSYTKQKIAFGKYRGDARDAQTEYEVIEEYKIGELELSLVKAQPKTGRTHQIRVHMMHIGHPLLGDDRYYTKNERKMDIDIPSDYDIESFFLHAKELSFPFNGEDQSFNVKYPDRFSALVHYLQGFVV